MDKSAIKIVLNIFKYISIVILIIAIVCNTDILSGICYGNIKNFLIGFTNLMRKNIQITSTVLFICIFVIFTCNIIIHFMKLYDESDELDICLP